MPGIMSRSPFSRSPRHSVDPNFTRAHSHTSSNPVNTLNTLSVPTPSPDTRRASLNVESRGMRRLEQRRNMEESHYLSCKARAQNFNPPIDLRLLDYVSTYDSNLMCAICRCPFVDPVILNECDHCFCRDCIRQCWNTNTNYTPLGPRGDCPTCRTPAKLGPRSATSKILVNLVDELMVRCPHADDGCKAEVRRCEVQDHANIYCGYTLVECSDTACTSPVRRRDAAQGCLHYGVSCLSCHKELQKWKLDTHWRSECPERQVHCGLCNSPVLYRDFEEHGKETCPSISVPCPGMAIGCTSRSKRGRQDVHAQSCTFAKLAPLLLKQQERLDEQEAAQKEMSRKLEVLETGFTRMEGILYPRSELATDSDRVSADSSRPPYLRSSLVSNDSGSLARRRSSVVPGIDFNVAEVAVIDPLEEASSSLGNLPSQASPPTHPAPGTPGPRPQDLPEPFSTDFDLASPSGFPPPSMNGGPYASPLHHLLSMHESLRDEITRISSTLSELDGRQSMVILNENLRTREEISYLGAQVGGLQRQVHWLTSAQLQRQQGRSSPVTAGSSSAAVHNDAGAGAGVEAAVSAVSTAATALRGAARMVNVGGSAAGGSGMTMRRGTSEEGRTKL